MAKSLPMAFQSIRFLLMQRICGAAGAGRMRENRVVNASGQRYISVRRRV